MPAPACQSAARNLTPGRATRTPPPLERRAPMSLSLPRRSPPSGRDAATAHRIASLEAAVTTLREDLDYVVAQMELVTAGASPAAQPAASSRRHGMHAVTGGQAS